MTAKTKKELQAENISLKEELAIIREKFAELTGTTQGNYFISV